jgi:hypothetical protein
MSGGITAMSALGEMIREYDFRITHARILLLRLHQRIQQERFSNLDEIANALKDIEKELDFKETKL